MFLFARLESFTDHTIAKKKQKTKFKQNLLLYFGLLVVII